MARISVVQQDSHGIDRHADPMKLSAGKTVVAHGRGEWIVRHQKLRLFPEGTISAPAQATERKRPSAHKELQKLQAAPAEIPGLTFQYPAHTPAGQRAYCNPQIPECIPMDRFIL